MKPGGNKSEEVKYGGARALIRQRSDGLWVVRWREAGKGRNTTLVSREKARQRAGEIVRGLAAGQGGQMMTVDDGQLVARLKKLAGDRSPFLLLGEIEDAVQRLGGADALARAIRFYEQSGMAKVERATMRAARNRFLDHYENRSVMTRAGVRKEIDAFVVSHSETMLVTELTTELLCEWISRRKLDGTKVGSVFRNNRLDTWRTFLNKCRAWNFWPKGEKHPAELIERQREPDRSPPIWTVETLRAALARLRTVGRVPDRLSSSVPLLRYVAIGCWAGLRPFELVRIDAADFDFERDYIHVRAEVAMKTMQERYVPIEPCLRHELLDAGCLMLDGKCTCGAESWPAKGKVCIVHSREETSIILRAAGIIAEWPQDVMRHSYISYRIARGDGIGVVAEHAGNSERVIRRSYRRPLRKEDGEAWFKRNDE